MRLLPRDPEIGWLPYLWLIYLANLVVMPAITGASPWVWLATGLGTLAFLPLYFWSYWVQGRTRLLCVAAMALLGALLTPLNAGASVFFIYAAAAAGYLPPSRRALVVIAILAVALGLEGWWLDVPLPFLVPGAVFTIVIGLISIFGAERHRARARLRLAHDEVERLAKLAERERIARDLHDLLGHTLSLVTLKAELAGKLLARDPQRAGQEIAEVERISREALAEVRAAVRGYRASGLGEEVASARLACEAAGISLAVELASPSLSSTAEAALALALREGVTNVVRHSAASRCEISLREEAGVALLTIADDGRGGSAPEGAGLAGMRERIAELGGSVERQVDGGTRLLLRLPLQAGASTPLCLAAAGAA